VYIDILNIGNIGYITDDANGIYDIFHIPSIEVESAFFL
jgi:hypothetical protein